VEPKRIFKSALIGVLILLAFGLCRQESLFGQVSGSGQASQPPAQASTPAQPAGKPEEVKKGLTSSTPVLEIKRLESESALYSIELRDVQLSDLFRVIAHDYNLNIVMDQGVSGTITSSFTNISLEEALEAIAEMNNLSIEKKGNIVKIKPNLLTKTFVLKYIEAKKFLEGSAPAGQSTAGQTSTGASATGIYSLLSEKGKILLGQQQNSLTVIDYPDNIKKVEDYLKVIDHKMETRVYKLKYLKADEVTGATSKSTTTTQSITPTGTQVSTTTSTSSASGGGTTAK